MDYGVLAKTKVVWWIPQVVSWLKYNLSFKNEFDRSTPTLISDGPPERKGLLNENLSGRQRLPLHKLFVRESPATPKIIQAIASALCCQP